MQNDWVIIFTTNLPHLAEIARQICQENGVEAVVMNKQDSVYKAFGDIEVLVNSENEEAARKLLVNLEAPGQEFQDGKK